MGESVWLLPDTLRCTLKRTYSNRGMYVQDVTFTELRNHAKAYFDLVEAGETVRVLRNGKPIAQIHPIQPDLPSWKRRQARPLAIGGEQISRLILEGRGD